MEDEIPIRDRLRDLYIEFFEKGSPLTLAQLSERSRDLVGQHVPFYSIRSWSSEGNWSSRIRGLMRENPNYITDLTFLKLWKDRLMASEEVSWRERSAAARGYVGFLKKIPIELRWSFETEIMEVAEYLRSMIFTRWDHIPSIPANQLSTAWKELDGMVDVVIEVDSDAVERDKILLEGRE